MDFYNLKKQQFHCHRCVYVNRIKLEFFFHLSIVGMFLVVSVLETAVKMGRLESSRIQCVNPMVCESDLCCFVVYHTKVDRTWTKYNLFRFYLWLSIWKSCYASHHFLQLRLVLEMLSWALCCFSWLKKLTCSYEFTLMSDDCLYAGRKEAVLYLMECLQTLRQKC